MAKRGPKPKRQEIVWTSDFAYGVGLMATDGNLSSDGRHLELTSKDRQQIENIQTCFHIQAKISTKASSGFSTDKRYFRIQWGDVYLYNFFLEIGLIPRKSLTIGALKIPDKYFFDFLRGSYDGDGCFYSYFDPRWENSFMFYLTFLSASYEHIVWLQEKIISLCGVKGSITKSGKRTLMASLKFAKADTLILLPLIYPSTTTRCLERKRLKIVRALRIVGITLPTLPEVVT